MAETRNEHAEAVQDLFDAILLWCYSDYDRSRQDRYKWASAELLRLAEIGRRVEAMAERDELERLDDNHFGAQWQLLRFTEPLPFECAATPLDALRQAQGDAE